MSYVIVVGREKPADAIVSHPSKDGQPNPNDQIRRFIPVGVHMLNNVASVWGRRVIKGSIPAGMETVEVLTPGYTGEIEFLKWGDPKGYQVTIRYLKQSRSLDVEYQDNVQKIRIDKERGADGSAQIELSAGENRFDDKKDELLITYLKVQPQNRDSVSKNPNPAIKGHTYFELTDDNVKKSSIAQREKSLSAGGIVLKAADKAEDLKVLLQLMGNREEFSDVDELSKPASIYEALLNFSNTNPNDFLSLIDGWKRKVSDAFSRAESYKALDLTKNGHIALRVDNKTEVIFSDVPGKGKDMLDWVLSTCLESETFIKMQGFISRTDKF